MGAVQEVSTCTYTDLQSSCDDVLMQELYEMIERPESERNKNNGNYNPPISGIRPSISASVIGHAKVRLLLITGEMVLAAILRLRVIW